jgi:hypothetical protein
MVEPITTGALVAGALSAGAATMATGMLSEAAKDAYAKLKNSIAVWAGHDVESLEKNPESGAREAVLAELVDKREDQERQQLAALAQALIAALGDTGKARAETRITVIAMHGGMAAGHDQTINYAAPSPNRREAG